MRFTYRWKWESGAILVSCYFNLVSWWNDVHPRYKTSTGMKPRVELHSRQSHFEAIQTFLPLSNSSLIQWL